MATTAYTTWVTAGRPFDLAKPIQELKTWAAANAIPCLGTIGNENHLTADKPQDHTPYAYTAWPEPLPGYIVCAIDLGNERGLGEAIEAGARAGKYPWLKYMNHSGVHLDSRDLDGDGKRWEESPSSDEHVHLSIRTDWIYKSIGAFNPWGNVVTYDETWRTDKMRNPYGDSATNPTIWPETAMFNIGRDTNILAKTLPDLVAALGRVEAKLAEPAPTPPPAEVEIDYAKLAAELIRQLTP